MSMADEHGDRGWPQAPYVGEVATFRHLRTYMAKRSSGPDTEWVIRISDRVQSCHLELPWRELGNMVELLNRACMLDSNQAVDSPIVMVVRTDDTWSLTMVFSTLSPVLHLDYEQLYAWRQCLSITCLKVGLPQVPAAVAAVDEGQP